ncbi:MAG TPA: TauD/TfdA family dioxygenase [Steroidobacteraceae bacterium]|jgi:alpha-ketoglutarate-dependent taurine dioxygenase|nr:TauD/TfdA family dioxygenase [Steroidobacteraceae bacterium]
MRLHPTGKFNNYSARYEYIHAEPIAAAMGAEITGVDIARVTDDVAEEIRHALFRHKMIFFRGQKLTHAEHEAFSLRFGRFAEDAYTQGVPGHRNVQPLIKEATDSSKMVFGEGWHTDSPFLEQPPAITVLRSVEVPPIGGDTMWANSALAYAMLSDTYREMIKGLRVRFSMRDVLKSVHEAVEVSDSPIGRLAATRDSESLPEDLRRKIRGNAHPLVRTHPVTGEKALYVDPSYGIGIEGMTPEESAPILQYLSEHLTQPAFTCRLRWEPDMVVIWDNRLCVHQAYNDYQGHRRELYRTTVAGETPA